MLPVVALEAVVKDSNDRPLTHLSQADFEIYEDGQKQGRASLARAMAG